MSSKMLPVLMMLLLSLWGSSALAASLQAEVKKQTVVDGETVLLYIIGEGLRGYPDTTALNRRFDIVGSRRQESQFVDNGQVKSRFTILLELLPKHLGVSDIPPFEADGQRSDKISIEVVERGTPGVVPRDNVFAELTLDNETPYVQAQAILTLHVFDDGSLAAAEPELPDIPDLQVEQIPGNAQRLETRNGVEYRVHSWRYALFPQRSGDFDIPRIKVVANVKDPAYGGNLILRNTPTRRINFRSDSIRMSVIPRPPATTAAWWLPVRQLDLKQTWSSDPASARVGEPLTYSLALTTSGATSTQLPEIKLTDVDGLKIYPDVPELASQPGDDGVISRRTEKWSIIPQRAGQVTLPEIRVSWWDTVADQERTTVIAQQQIVVAGDGAVESGNSAGNTANNSISVAADTAQADQVDATGLEALENVDSPAPAQQQETARSLASQLLPSRNNLWVWISAMIMTGWLLTLLAWLVSSRRNRAAGLALTDTSEIHQTSEQQAMRDLAALSGKGDQSRYRAGLMHWAIARWPQDTPVSVAEIGRRLRNPELSAQLSELEASIYSQRAAKVSLQSVHTALQAALEKVTSRPEQSRSAISRNLEARMHDSLPRL